MGDRQAKNIKCWEFFRCKKKGCPAYKSVDLRCWLFSGTHCREEIQGKFLEKTEICIDCEVFDANIDVLATKETLALVNKQLKQIRRIVNDREDSLRSTLNDLQKRQTEITALLEASRSVHEYHDFKNSVKAIFDICKNLIEATSGYVALLSKDGTENEVLFLDSGGLPCTVDPTLPMPIRGLRAEAYHKAKTVYHNYFHQSKFMKFMPNGHVRLNNVLFSPMIINEKTVGLLGLANKPAGFTENDARMATAFAEFAALAIITRRAEEALIAERDRAKSYLDIAGVVIFVINGDQKVSLINKKGCEILGYNEKDIIGKNWVDTFIPKRNRDEVRAAFKKLMAGEIEPVEYFENSVLTKDKEERIFAWHNTYLRDEDSKIIATLSSGEDITERKKAEQEIQILNKELEQRVEERTVELANTINMLKDEEEKLRGAEVHYRTVADFTYDWIYWESQNGTMLYVSPSCERITGYRQEEFIETPKLLQEIILSEDKETWSMHRQEALTEHKMREVQFRIKKRDGQIRWIEHACQPVKDEQGNFLGFRASNRDITDRKKIEEKLIKSEESLEEAQRITHVGNWNWDIQTNKLHWSNEIYRIFGLVPQEFGATYEAFLKSVHPDDREFVKEAVNEALYGKPYNIEHRIVLPNGKVKIVQERGKVTFGEHGEPIKMLGTVQDITEKKEKEQRLIMTEKLASLGQMSSGVAHEINNPLASISACAEGLIKRVREGAFNPNLFKDYLEIINEEVARCKNVTRAVLGFAKNTNYEKEKIDLISELEKILELISIQGRLKNIQVIKNYKELPPVRANKDEIKQVFLIIVLNALDAMEDRGILILETDVDNKQVFIKINDTGLGISSDFIEEIFDPFFTTKSEKGGIGLGLSIANKIITENNGNIDVISEIGKGTTFKISLPK